MNDEIIQIDCDYDAGKVHLGPAQDFHVVEYGGERFWIAGTFYNVGHESFVKATVDGSGELKSFSMPFSMIRRNQDRSVSVTTDRYARVPVYIVMNGDDIWISTSLRWLASTSGLRFEFNEQSIGELLTFKFVLGTRTIINDVVRVSPGTIQTLTADGTWESERYWYPVPPPNRRRLETELDTLTELFADGVQKCVDGIDNVVVTLSGGLDSRANLAAVLSTGTSVSALTTGIAGGMDHRYAEMAAETAGVPLRLALLDADYRRRFFEFTQQSLEAYEGMLLTPGTEALWMIESSSDLPIQLVLHGALGELAKGATANHFEVSAPEIASCQKDVAAFLSSRYESAHQRILLLLKAPVRKRLQGQALQSLRKSAQALAERMAPLDVPFAMQVVEHFRNSGVYSSKIWGQRYPIMFPFADPQYVDHMLSVRAEDRIGPQFHYELLRRLHDGLFRCPESNSGVAPSASPLIRTVSNFGVKVMNKLGMKRAAGHTDFCAWIDAMQPNIEDVLLKESFLCDMYWDADQIRKYVARSKQGDQSSASDLYRLVCLELTYKMFKSG